MKLKRFESLATEINKVANSTVRVYENKCDGEVTFINIYDYNTKVLTQFDSEGYITQVRDMDTVKMMRDEITELNIQAKQINYKTALAYAMEYEVI